MKPSTLEWIAKAEGDFVTDLNVLTAFAVAYRYPGVNAIKLDAHDAIRRCKIIRRTVRLSFGLPV